jgi:hypothetical protein
VHILNMGTSTNFHGTGISVNQQNYFPTKTVLPADERADLSQHRLLLEYRTSTCSIFSIVRRASGCPSRVGGFRFISASTPAADTVDDSSLRRGLMLQPAAAPAFVGRKVPVWHVTAVRTGSVRPIVKQ